MRDQLGRSMSKELMDGLMQELQQVSVKQITRGRIVTTLGPWSNGHEEQCAIVTHVYGSGFPGDKVNLFIFVDLSQPLIVEDIPWYPSRREAEQALAANAEKANLTGGAVCCYFPARTE
jgi:hypothetical protein